MHRPAGWRDKAARDLDYATRRDPQSVAMLNSRRWRKARQMFLASHPLCAKCSEHGRVTPATVVDHVVPHCGDPSQFWDAGNWQPLCRPCHSRKTARLDGGFGNARR